MKSDGLKSSVNREVSEDYETWSNTTYNSWLPLQHDVRLLLEMVYSEASLQICSDDKSEIISQVFGDS